MLSPHRPALALAPMDGITDAPMRALQGATGAFSYAVSEFLRVSVAPLPAKVFRRDVPELTRGAKTDTGMPVQVQLLGGDPERMALSALAALRAGATAIDLNFGCPAPTVNRHDGGASLLKTPCRIRDVVAAVRSAVPSEVPVSAKLRLGWDSIDAVDENAAMAAEGGATWITIHARTRAQGYRPPVYWPAIGRVQKALGLPIVANGDIWTRDDFLRCQDETGCRHFMIGRGALANPALAYQIAQELGLRSGPIPQTDWADLFQTLVRLSGDEGKMGGAPSLQRIKQWIKLADGQGNFPFFHELKAVTTLPAFFEGLNALTGARHREPVAV